jgi:hypothetical protein
MTSGAFQVPQLTPLGGLVVGDQVLSALVRPTYLGTSVTIVAYLGDGCWVLLWLSIMPHILQAVVS